MAAELSKKPTVERYILEGVTDFLIVYADSRYENELEITGENGEVINLVTDGELEDKRYRCWGTTVAIPKRITPDKTMFSDGGKPVKMNEIQMCVEPGDKVYFSYLALQDNMEVEPNHYAIAYSDIICIAKNNELIPVGSHVLLKPAYPEGVIDTGNGVMGRQNSFGMIVELNVPPKKNEGVISHIGLPLKGKDLGLQVGMKVGIDKWQFGHWYTIEGEDFLVCRQKDISFIFND